MAAYRLSVTISVGLNCQAKSRAGLPARLVLGPVLGPAEAEVWIMITLSLRVTPSVTLGLSLSLAYIPPPPPPPVAVRSPRVSRYRGGRSMYSNTWVAVRVMVRRRVIVRGRPINLTRGDDGLSTRDANATHDDRMQLGSEYSRQSEQPVHQLTGRPITPCHALVHGGPWHLLAHNGLIRARSKLTTTNPDSNWVALAVAPDDLMSEG